MLEYRFKGHRTDIQVHLTNNCNHFCIHCYTGSCGHFKKWLPVKCFENVLSFAQKDSRRIVRILGGEIITRNLKALPYLVSASKKSIPLVLCTNGFACEVWEQNKIEPNQFKEIIVSCYGFNEQHDNMTGLQGSFSKTWRTIKCLGKQQNRSYELTVNTLVTQGNYKYFLDFIHHLCYLHVDEVKILLLSPLGYATSNYRNGFDSQSVIGGKRNLLEKKLYSCIRNGELKNMRIVWESTKHKFSKVLKKNYSTPCRINKKSMVTIDFEGNVYPCHLMIYQHNFALGNISKYPLSKILENYEKNGSKIQFEKFLLNSYDNCPAYLAYNQKMHTDNDIRISRCPLLLELLNVS